ncbi:feruloyl-CoA synthase [Beijerinckia sp. 28-YEA-48]|nr:feruloyl-CoA synthase [Beijerinckia sp. 28-YEA-48]
MSLSSPLSPLPLDFTSIAVSLVTRSDGSMILRSNVPTVESEDRLHDYLRHWAAVRPQQTFLAERNKDGNGWREITYAEADDAVSRLGESLASRPLGPDRPILILSGNSIDHQLMALAAMSVGIPYTPLSVAYSTLSGDLGKLRAILTLLDPGLIFVDDAQPFVRALAIPEMQGREIVVARGHDLVPGAQSLNGLLSAQPGNNLKKRAEAVTADTVAKILFTSGSTGSPKGVPTTHRMMTTSQEQIASIWPFMSQQIPVILDWLPWSHVFGGSFSLNSALRHGGIFYIDDGRPVPGEFARTVRNIQDIRPTHYWNVPKAYELLVPALRDNELARKNFFSDLLMMFYAGASLPEPIWRDLVELGRQTTGRDVPMLTSWGLTETAPSITIVNCSALEVGNIGIPVPGLELKLVPHQGKMEARARGPNVMAGYWKLPEATAAAFDEEGYFRTGDALKLADPHNASKGVIFDGRTTEDFKLLSGTWVDAASVRLRVLAAFTGLASDVVVTGADRSEIGVLILPTAGRNPDDPDYRDALGRALSKANDAVSGSAQVVAKAGLLRQMPTFDSGEITEKGSLNARLIRERHRDEIDRLHSGLEVDTIVPA